MSKEKYVIYIGCALLLGAFIVTVISEEMDFYDFFSSAVFGSLINQERCDVMSIHHSNISSSSSLSTKRLSASLILSKISLTSFFFFKFFFHNAFNNA